jgi:Zn-dependent peptidase ImmA (M78 family)/DNA-binding XRE family transcriptional regulator
VATSAALPNNLRRLRDARKLSQAEVAEKAALSRIAYGNIESGAASPRVDTLVRIAAALGVSMQDLFTPVRVLRHVRFRQTKKMTSREQLLASVGRWLDDYNELERMLDERVELNPRLAQVVKDHAGKRARATAAAAATRKAFRLDDEEPVHNICGLLEDRSGIKVFPVPLASDDFFGLSVATEDGGPAIVVNVWDRISVERWIFTAAHELGHLMLHRGAYDVSQTEEIEVEEREADQFASAFLMPPTAFDKTWERTSGLSFVDRVFKMKRMFRVSYATVLYRLKEQPGYDDEVWPRFYAAFKQQYGRALTKREEPAALTPATFGREAAPPADEPNRLSADDFREDRLVRLVRKAVDGEHITLARAAEILGLSLREMRELSARWVR